MFLFLPLYEKLSSYLPAEQVEMVARAFLLAADAHEAQYRSSGEPYITHPVAVSGILADMHMDAESIAAALMHDVIEDTDVPRETIVAQFGEKVAELVEGVTKLTKIKFKTRAEAQAENFRKMMLAMVEDIRVILIKMADRYHNMQTLDALVPEKRRRIARETLEIYAPIANRLGMNNFKTIFQDLGFRAMYPLRYRVLEACVKTAEGSRQKLMGKLHSLLAEKLQPAGITGEHIIGREKRLYSIFKKMRNKGLSFAEIMDVYGFRVVVKDVMACYQVLGLVHALFTPVPGRFKDYIAIPKANGYQSLHTTLFGPYGVPIEIQIRTEAMDNTAENGIAAHWLYKATGYASTTEVKTREWLQQLMDMQLRAGNSLEFIENVKIDLFPDEVYVFTPKGDIMELPRGATPVDFAYAVHTQVGNSCIAARVNRRPMPLSTRLVNGQTVEVIRSDSAQPNPAWLGFVVTGKAKTAIRHFLKVRQDEEAIAFGKKLLSYSLSELKLRFEDLSKQQLKDLLTRLQFESVSHLFLSIGHGERPSVLVAHQIAEICKDSGYEPEIDDTSETVHEAMLISGAEGMNIRYATCCYPIPGDEVVGVLNKGQGIVVHTADCREFARISKNLAPEQLLHLAWSEGEEQYLPVELYLESKNYRGALADISTIISNAGVSILHVEVVEMQESYGIITLLVSVTGRKHLATLLRRLRNLKGLMRVSRRKVNEPIGDEDDF